MIHCRLEILSRCRPQIWGCRTTNKWPQKGGARPCKHAGSVYWPFIYISNEESSIYKKESDTRLHAVAIHWLDVVWFLRFFPNLRRATCQHVGTKGRWRALEWCWQCPLAFYIHIQTGITNIQEREWWYTYTFRWYIVGWKFWEADLRRANYQQVATDGGWRAL